MIPRRQMQAFSDDDQDTFAALRAATTPSRLPVGAINLPEAPGPGPTARKTAKQAAKAAKRARLEQNGVKVRRKARAARRRKKAKRR